MIRFFAVNGGYGFQWKNKKERLAGDPQYSLLTIGNTYDCYRNVGSNARLHFL